MLAAFGLLGYLMRRLDYPSAPLILGLVLGDAMERALRQSLMIVAGGSGHSGIPADFGHNAGAGGVAADHAAVPEVQFLAGQGNRGKRLSDS